MKLTYAVQWVIINDMSGDFTLIKDDRLAAVYDMLGKSPTVVDIGCDHGYLSAALITGERAKKVIASDISEASVSKAAKLAASMGISDRMKTVLADGLDSAMDIEPPYSIAICGMGGELIAGILERGRSIALSAKRIVMQPMRSEAKLRRYLYENGYRILDERVVLDEGRYYQIISACPLKGDTIPEGFPKDYFRFGWVMASKPEPLLMPLLEHYRSVYEKELKKAEKRGKKPEKILKEISSTNELIKYVSARSEGRV